MADASNLVPDDEKQAAVKQAADELADRFKSLADTFAEKSQPRSVQYGPGRVGRYRRRQSPAGFVLPSASLRMLLPDGRLWSYRRSEASRFPDGRFYDARGDHAEFVGGRSNPGGREFVFLGAVLDKYTFGWAAPAESGDATASGGLCAIYDEARAVRYASAEEAFNAIAEMGVIETDPAE